ncbi:hypothetical protein HMPREF1022_02896 [Desulfovibrio sp. 6_1_46AFAA]|uniref:hypothetical protein n=1 Tax=Desulfovibrio sp. 6_1_46AFAA TaxID=665942 RepID=UPI0002236D53|nr:hypothetical protein [Desulfovibrio sp. 6_1_46AFAA]EGW50074.1 hypothetical protein HMPREF1022_02896 [Desulfovibrio sp. 6_1_46AFAA]
MDPNLNSAFDILRDKLGTHGAAASYLGMTRDHYCALRNGRAHIPKRTAELIVLKAKAVASQEQSVSNSSDSLEEA